MTFTQVRRCFRNMRIAMKWRRVALGREKATKRKGKLASLLGKVAGSDMLRISFKEGTGLAW